VITIIGAGKVGGSGALCSAVKRLDDQILLLDIVEGLPQGEAMDLNHMLSEQGIDVEITGSNNYEDMKGSDIVVMVAGAGRKPGMTRMDLLKINAEKVTPTYVLSGPRDIFMSLRWIAMMSDRVKCDLAASTGVHDGTGVVKQLLAGAKAVQVASTLYKNGPEQIGVMLKELEEWMNKKGYNSIDDFRGKLSYGKVDNPSLLQRVQFIKYFGTFTNK